MGTKESLQELVNAYCDEPTAALRDAIINRSIPLVRSILGKINAPDTMLSQYEDLESAGIMGLLQALDNYMPRHKVQFNTFAYYRIRGNIVDYLRKIDEVPRLQRATYGKAQSAIDALMQELGRMPEDEEVAEYLEIDLEDYYKVLKSVQQRSALSLNEPKYEESGSSESHSDFLEDKNIERPDASIEKEMVRKKLEKHIRNLKEREQLILALYYYEDLTLKEIAAVLGLTEARISQILGKLLMTLRVAMKKEPIHLR
jgi:RNA polymerase sigma factor for flagellar operon FliA